MFCEYLGMCSIETDCFARLHAVWGSVDKGVPFVVEDVRGREQDFTLDRNGLVWPTHKSALSPEDLIDNVRWKLLLYLVSVTK